MKITKKEFGRFSQAVVKECEQGKVTTAQEDDFLEWGNKTLDSLEDNVHVEVPVLFQGLYRHFQQSKNYVIDSEEELLQAEQRANPPVRYEGPHFEVSPQRNRINMKNQFLEKFEQITGQRKSAMEAIDFARRGQSPSDLSGALWETRLWTRKHRSDFIRATIMNEPLQRDFWSGLPKALGFSGRGMSNQEREAVNAGLVDEDGKGFFQKSLTAGASPGSLWLSEAVAEAVFDICPLFGAYKTLRVIQLAKGRSKFVKITGLPTFWWYIASELQGQAFPTDGSLSGTSISVECPTLGFNIEISLELLQDEKVDWATALLEKIARGLAQGLDYACFAADGSADAVNGGMTSIFKHASVPTVSSRVGRTSITSLYHEDLLLAPAAIAPAGLQREDCRWYVHPNFLPKLLLLKDGNLFLCQTPAQSQTGEFTLAGWPMTLTTLAPSVDGAGLPIAAFCWPEAFTVAMREDAEVMTGEPKWNQALKTIRCLTRARCEMGDASMFAILKLAAE